jgi:hypothetical protein
MQPNDQNQDYYDEFDTLGSADEDIVHTRLSDKASKAQNAKQKVFYAVVFVMLCLLSYVGWSFIPSSDSQTEMQAVVNSIQDAGPAIAKQQEALPEGLSVVDKKDTPIDNKSGAKDPMLDAAVAPAIQVSTEKPKEKVIEVAEEPNKESAPEVKKPVETVTASALPTPEVVTDAVTTPVVPAPPAADTLAVEQPAPVEPVKEEVKTTDQPTVLASSLPAPTAVATLPQANIQAVNAMPSPAAAPLTPIEPTSNTAAAPQATDAATDARIAELESQLQTLASELAATPEASATPDATMAKQLETLSAQLEKISAQADALDQRTASLAGEVQNKVTEPEKTDVTPAATPKPAVKKPVAQAKPKAKPVAAAPKAPAVKWELRSAQPGVAWLGRAGSDEMTRYAVGEAVPGLGQITSVTQDAAGKWAVRATNGAVYQ